MKVLLIVLMIALCANVSADNEYFDVSSYWLLSDNLYTNETGELFYQSFRLKNNRKELIYLKRFGADFGQEYLEKKLKEVIDPDTWASIGSHFYRDQYNFYCFHAQTIGGMLVKMPDFDPKKTIKDRHRYIITSFTTPPVIWIYPKPPNDYPNTS